MPSSFKKVTIGLVLIIIVITVLSYFLSLLIPKKADITLSSRVFPLIHITNRLPAGFKIIYQKDNDLSGRSIIFESGNPSKYHSGIGVISMQNMPNTISYITGSFQEFDSISGSNDKYILLRDNIHKKQLSKYRIMMGSTMLRVENLNKIELGTLKSIESIGLVNNIDELEKYILLDDAIILTPGRKSEETVAIDNENYIIVNSLIIRRFGGKSAI